MQQIQQAQHAFVITNNPVPAEFYRMDLRVISSEAHSRERIISYVIQHLQTKGKVKPGPVHCGQRLWGCGPQRSLKGFHVPDIKDIIADVTAG